MSIIKNSKNIAKILFNNVGFGKVYKNSILYFGGTGTPPDPPTPPNTPLYLSDTGDIMLKAGTYKAVVRNIETGENSIEDYQVTEDTQIPWRIPETYKNIDGTRDVVEGATVSANTSNISIPPGFDFGVALEPVEWSAENWGPREYQEGPMPGTAGKVFTINFASSKYYTGYSGSLQSTTNTCTYKVKHLLNFKVPESANYEFNYSLSTGPYIKDTSFTSPATFNLYRKSDDTLLYTKSGTLKVRSYNNASYVSLSYSGDKLQLAKDEELYAEIIIDKIIRVRNAGTNSNELYFTFDQYLQAVYSLPSGSEPVTLMINKYGEMPADIMLREYQEGMEDIYPNGLVGTINWSDGIVSSIT